MPDSFRAFVDHVQPHMHKWSPAEWCTTDLSERVPAT